MSNKDILNIAQTMQSLAIANESIKLVNKKKKVKDFLDVGIKTNIGTSFIKINADLIDSL